MRDSDCQAIALDYEWRGTLGEGDSKHQDTGLAWSTDKTQHPQSAWEILPGLHSHADV